MLTIDGSQGEGGGQIIRTALALSLVTGTPFRIENIRAKRRKPGLMRQHLTAVEAAARIGRAELEGASVGSFALTFKPGPVQAGDYAFAVGTAGSATLVLQTVLPALLRADAPSHLILEGGTHNPLAPPFDFLEKAFLPLLRRMGPKVEARLERAGFYPAGGGKMSVDIEPAPLSRLDLLERGEAHGRARALVANLPENIARRELKVVREKMNWDESRVSIEQVRGSPGPGNVLLVEVQSPELTEVFSGFGERGVPAEDVAGKVVDEVRRYLAAGVPVGRHLADQLLIPLAMAGAGSFRTHPLSGHAHTQIETIRRFLDVPIAAREVSSGIWQVDVG